MQDDSNNLPQNASEYETIAVFIFLLLITVTIFNFISANKHPVLKFSKDLAIFIIELLHFLEEYIQSQTFNQKVIHDYYKNSLSNSLVSLFSTQPVETSETVIQMNKSRKSLRNYHQQLIFIDNCYKDALFGEFDDNLQKISLMAQEIYKSLSSARSSGNAYVQAMKALQDKIRIMETQKPQVVLTEPSEIAQLRQQTQQLLRENESLSQQLRVLRQRCEGTEDQGQQIEILQQERLQHLKEYQERVSELLKKNEEIRKEKHELSAQVESLTRQLNAFKTNERSMLHRSELLKYEENHKLHETIQEQRQKIDVHDLVVKKLEKRIEKMQSEKHTLEAEFIDYKDKCPQFKLAEYERQLLQIRCQLEEKENSYLKTIEEIQQQRSLREDVLQRKIQELMAKNSELQSIVHQQTLDIRNLKQQQDDKTTQQIRSKRRNFSQDESDHLQDNRVSRLNLDILSPQLTSPRLDNTNIKHSQLRQTIKDCLEELRQSTPFNKFAQEQQLQQQVQQFQPITAPTHQQSAQIQTSFQQSQLYSSNKRKLMSPPLTNRNVEIENQLKQLNDKYEMLIRQAQKETDFKEKAQIRRQLLDIAEQIKELNKQK